MLQAASYEWIVWSDRKALRLTAAGYEAILVPSLGANVISLQGEVKERRLDILRTPRSAEVLLANPFSYGIPVLFPANRVSGGAYAWDGVTYNFPKNFPNNIHIHGVLHNREWPVDACFILGDRVHVRLCLDTDKDQELRSHFPISMEICLEIVLGADGLTHNFTLKNKSMDKEIPAGLAYHTAFRVDFCENSGSVTLHVPLLERSVDDPVDMLPSGGTRALDDFEAAIASGSGAPPLMKKIDGLFTAVPGKPDMIMCDHQAGVEVVYRAGPENNYWIVYNKTATEGFVAVEPQTWLSNAMNTGDPLKHHAVMVRPNTSWSSSCRIFARPASSANRKTSG